MARVGNDTFLVTACDVWDDLHQSGAGVDSLASVCSTKGRVHAVSTSIGGVNKAALEAESLLQRETPGTEPFQLFLEEVCGSLRRLVRETQRGC